MGLLFYRYLIVELGEKKLSLPKFAEILENIKLAIVRGEGKEAEIVVEDMNAQQARIFGVFRLDRFVPQ